MTYRIFDTAAVDGRRKLVAHELEARAVRLNQFDSQPHQEGKEHDERESGQEEVYFALRGSGVLRVDGEDVPLEPGRYVLVEPEATRQVAAGPDGLSYAVAGAVVDR
ncbi:MAG TPA: cupin domain-containing protein [Gaiellaceae bacterium]|nr:cupin domain-containing protein [Gaiellaceae bacterium]